MTPACPSLQLEKKAFGESKGTSRAPRIQYGHISTCTTVCRLGAQQLIPNQFFRAGWVLIYKSVSDVEEDLRSGGRCLMSLFLDAFLDSAAHLNQAVPGPTKMAMSVSLGQCGKRLLPVIIDQLAHEDPDRPWASIPRDDYDLSQGYADISYAAFANAINKLAWMVEKSIGRSDSFETIAYLGTPDVRYHMVCDLLSKTLSHFVDPLDTPCKGAK